MELRERTKLSPQERSQVMVLLLFVLLAFCQATKESLSIAIPSSYPNRFALISFLGSGKSATVYSAKGISIQIQTSLDTLLQDSLVALKVFNSGCLNDMYTEIDIHMYIQRQSSPSDRIAKLLDTYSSSLVFEFMGLDLQQASADILEESLDTRVYLLLEIVRAIRQLHDTGMRVHVLIP